MRKIFQFTEHEHVGAGQFKRAGNYTRVYRGGSTEPLFLSRPLFHYHPQMCWDRKTSKRLKTYLNFNTLTEIESLDVDVGI